jgi:pyruvate/2-oxoglutarate dehydrogenase complex dihydrolipoamide acyltransferase (E2) component
MTTQVLLPKLGYSMNDGDLTEWLADDGAAVVEGQPLYSLESDKTVSEVEAPATGVLKILKPAGENYEVGTVLAEIEN